MTQNSGGSEKEILCDRYLVQRELSKKAGKRSLLARDLHTRDLVVVKLLIFGNSIDWNDLKLFEREAETLKSLRHPAIPRYRSYFEIDTPDLKGFALVQNYIPGISLEELLKAGHTFSETEAKELAQGLLSILEYLHGRQPPVIHRDIKPSNILLTNISENTVGDVYLVDFGSVQTVAQRINSTMTIVGTYGYMSPEQMVGRATPASDLYSLGATLIYIVTGQNPADLPQKDLVIQFEQAANVSSAFKIWLRWMTEPIASKRLNSVESALRALISAEESTNQEQTFKRRTKLKHGKPARTKILLTKDPNFIEIIIPPAGVNDSFTIISFAAYMFILISLSTPYILYSNPLLLWIMLILSLMLIIHLGTCLFGKKRLFINRKQISLNYDLFGVERHVPLPSLTRDIIRLDVSTTPYNQTFLTIWAGVCKYELSTQSYFFPITPPELDWLANELSDWLGLSIT